jgi:integrase
MSRTPGLIKRKWQWKSKDDTVRSGWSYATRVRVKGKDRLFVHGTQNHGDALTKHRRLLEGLEEINVELVAPWSSISTRFTWLKSTTVAAAAREAASAFGREGSFGLQSAGNVLLDDTRELRDERLREGDRLQLVSRLTVDAAHEQWRAGDLAVRRNNKGQQDAAARYLRHVSPLLGQKRLDTLTGEDIRELRVQLDSRFVVGRARVLKPETVRHTLADLRCFLHWAADKRGGNFIAVALWPGLVLPRIGKRLPDRLSDEEVEAVLTVGEPHAFVVRLGLGTGLRWGDMCRTQAADLKRDASGGWCLEVAVGKTGEVLRVPVTNNALVREIRGRIGRLVPFSEKSGTVFNRTVRRRSHVERFHVHQLRHTYACRYLECGGSLAALQQILGHASVTTTERYARLLHAHVMQDAQRVGGSLEMDNNGDKKVTAL